jgi:hypothetical protein
MRRLGERLKLCRYSRSSWWPPVPPRRVRRAVIFGLVGLVQFAQRHGRAEASDA